MQTSERPTPPAARSVSPGPWLPRSRAIGIALAVTIWVAMLALTLAFRPLLGRTNFVFFWVAVLAAAWLVNFWGAVVAALLSTAAVHLFLVEPYFELFPFTLDEGLGFLVFVMASLVVSMLARTAAHAQSLDERHIAEIDEYAARLDERTAELEQQMEEAQALGEELEQANEELATANESMQEALARSAEAHEESEQARQRALSLLALASALSRATSVEDIADIVLRESAAATGADAGALALLETTPFASGELEFRMTRRAGYAESLNTRWPRFPVVRGRPLSDAVLTLEPVILETAADWRARYPEMARETPELDHEAMVNLPIVADGRAIAGLTLSFREARRFDDGDRTFLATIGEQCGMALARGRAFEAERHAHESSAFLSEASHILAGSLDYEATLRAVAALSVPVHADWCAVDMVKDPAQSEWPPKVERLAVVHQEPAKVAWAHELAERMPTDWSATTGLPRVLREGVTEFYPAITDEMLVAAARSPEHLALLRQIGFSSLIIVPLRARGQILGALTLVMAESGRRYDEADRALAEHLARRAAIAVDNARLYREAERARTVAEEANRAKSEFLATMSHELRTPLNAIGGYTELLEIGVHGDVTETQREVLRRIQRSQRALLALINDILSFARVEAGRLEYEIAPVSASEVLADIEPLVLPQVTEKGLTFEIQRGSSSPLVAADREKLLQILLNLVVNAVKATPSGGRITVGCAAPDPDGTALFTVTDTGIGIPPDKLERIFEPFVQLGRSLVSGHSGAGLGLAISRDLARGMGGDLTADSSPGSGARFTLRLPLASMVLKGRRVGTAMDTGGALVVDNDGAGERPAIG
jgi:signal transduction histidine kinase